MRAALASLDKSSIALRKMHSFRLVLIMQKLAARENVMRRLSVGAAVLALALVNPAGTWSGVLSRVADPSPEAESVVDLELLLAVDVSLSMDVDELAMQRQGYAEAIVSKEFLSALKEGTHGKIAISYFEWSSAYDQKTIVPWRIIDGPESAESVATEISNIPVRRGSRTSISGAMNFGLHAFSANPYRGSRRVIDISGDGPNNSGDPVLAAREAVLSAGITINGLPVMIKSGNPMTDIEQLDVYYEDCVIGGRGSFMIAIKDRAKFKEAIRAKLVLEVAKVSPLPTMTPAQSREPRVSCTIGETIWRDRRGR